MGVHVHLLAFLGVAAVLVVTPGVDMALVTKNALLYGRRQALASALGVNLGIAVWTFASALGLAAVIRASAPAFDALKFAGAVYLVALGIASLRASRRREAQPEPAEATPGPRVSTPARACGDPPGPLAREPHGRRPDLARDPTSHRA